MNNKKREIIEICIAFVIIVGAVVITILKPAYLAYLLLPTFLAAAALAIDSLEKRGAFDSLRYEKLWYAVIIIVILLVCVSAKISFSDGSYDKLHPSDEDDYVIEYDIESTEAL